MAIVYLGIGSNLGNRLQNIERAIEALKAHQIQILKPSTIIETDPVGNSKQNKFLNAVLKTETSHPPQALLKILQSIEKELLRVKTLVNGPRTIDLDILLYDRLSLQTPELTIPHPRMLKRDFVMNPLKEIAPDLVEELTHAHH